MIDSSSGEEDVFSISDEEGVPAAAIQVPVLGYVPVTNINPPSGYDIPFHIQEYDNNKHSLIVNALKRKRNEETTSNKTIQKWCPMVFANPIYIETKTESIILALCFFLCGILIPFIFDMASSSWNQSTNNNILF